MQSTMLLILLLFAVTSTQANDKLSLSNITACRGLGSELDACIVRTANEIFPRIVAGELSSMGLNDLDPIVIPRMAMEKGNAVFPAFRFYFLDTEHRGWQRGRVLSSRAQPELYRFAMTLSLPEYLLRIREYDVEGRLLFWDVRGVGTATIKFFGNTYDVSIQGEPYQRKGRRYMRIKEFKLKAIVDDMHIDALGNGEFQALNKALVSLLNLNSRTLAAAGAPMSDALYGPLYKALIERVFTRVPYDVLFPDAPRMTQEEVSALPRAAGAGAGAAASEDTRSADEIDEASDEVDADD